MGVNTDMPDMSDDENTDDQDMLAKQKAMKSLSKHIGADAGQQDEEAGGDPEAGEEYDPQEGAIPQMHYQKKKKSGGGGGGMGGMGGMMGGGGGMDMSSMGGMMGG